MKREISSFISNLTVCDIIVLVVMTPVIGVALFVIYGTMFYRITSLICPPGAVSPTNGIEEWLCGISYYLTELPIVWISYKRPKWIVRPWHIFVATLVCGLNLVTLDLLEGGGGNWPPILTHFSLFLGLPFVIAAICLCAFMCIERAKRYAPRHKTPIAILSIIIGPLLTGAFCYTVLKKLI